MFSFNKHRLDCNSSQSYVVKIYTTERLKRWPKENRTIHPSQTLFDVRVLMFTFFFALFTFAYAVSMFIAFGNSLEIYRDLTSSFFSSFGQLLGESALEDMTSQSKFFGTAFYLLMAVLGTVVITNIFIGVVGVVYADKEAEAQSAWELSLLPLMAARELTRWRVAAAGAVLSGLVVDIGLTYLLVLRLDLGVLRQRPKNVGPGKHALLVVRL